MHFYGYDGQVNIYGYVNGNPVSLIDPTGEIGLPAVIAILAVVPAASTTIGGMIDAKIRVLVDLLGPTLNEAVGTLAKNDEWLSRCLATGNCDVLQQSQIDYYPQCVGGGLRDGAQLSNVPFGPRGFARVGFYGFDSRRERSSVRSLGAPTGSLVLSLDWPIDRLPSTRCP